MVLASFVAPSLSTCAGCQTAHLHSSAFSPSQVTFPFFTPKDFASLLYFRPISSQMKTLGAVTLCTISLICRLSAATSSPSSPLQSAPFAPLCCTTALHRRCFHFVLVPFTHAPYHAVPPWRPTAQTSLCTATSAPSCQTSAMSHICLPISPARGISPITTRPRSGLQVRTSFASSLTPTTGGMQSTASNSTCHSA